MPDIEMKPADKKDEKKEDKKDDKKTDKKDEKKEKEEPPKPPPTPIQEIKLNVVLIERAVATLEPRFAHRALRTMTALRKRLDDLVLRNAVEEVFVKGTRWIFLGMPSGLRGKLFRHADEAVSVVLVARAAPISTRGNYGGRLCRARTRTQGAGGTRARPGSGHVSALAYDAPL